MSTEKKKYETPRYEVIKFDSTIVTKRSGKCTVQSVSYYPLNGDTTVCTTEFNGNYVYDDLDIWVDPNA